MIRARVAPDGRNGFRCWHNDGDGRGFGWVTFPTFAEALAEAVSVVTVRAGGGSVRVSSDGVRASVEGGES